MNKKDEKNMCSSIAKSINYYRNPIVINGVFDCHNILPSPFQMDTALFTYIVSDRNHLIHTGYPQMI